MTVEELVKELEEKYPDMEFSIKRQTKDNQLFDTVRVNQKTDNSFGSIYYFPTTGIEDKYYKAICEGIDDNMKTMTTNNTLKNTLKDYSQEVIEFDRIKDSIFPELMKDSPENRNFIAEHDFVSNEHLDMLVRYSVKFVEPDDIYSVGIPTYLLDRWDISKAELHEIAVGNLARETYIERREGIDVLTNKVLANGAAQLLNKDAMDKYLKALEAPEATVFIIPSSVNEIIAVQYTEDELMVKSIKQSITDVNYSILSPDEVLSDNLYVYDGKERQLYLCDDYLKEKNIENTDIEEDIER